MSFSEFLDQYLVIVFAFIGIVLGAVSGNVSSCLWAIVAIILQMRLNKQEDYVDILEDHIDVYYSSLQKHNKVELDD